MKILKTANYKKAFDINRYESEGMLGENTGRTVGEGRESLKQQGYRPIKSPMFGGEEWKNDQGDLIYYVPGGGLLSLEEYKEQYVKMFSPTTREDEIIKQQWLKF